MKKKDLEKNLDLWIIEQKHDELAENTLKSMNFKMPVETVKKKFFPDEATLEACVEAGKEYAKLIK